MRREGARRKCVGEENGGASIVFSTVKEGLGQQVFAQLPRLEGCLLGVMVRGVYRRLELLVLDGLFLFVDLRERGEQLGGPGRMLDRGRREGNRIGDGSGYHLADWYKHRSEHLTTASWRAVLSCEISLALSAIVPCPGFVPLDADVSCLLSRGWPWIQSLEAQQV